MATKIVRKNKLLATLVNGDNRGPCAFCGRDVDDEIIYGKLYAIGDLHCHYFCVLLSCCLIQKGKDTEGLFGFLYLDIQAEIERSKKHRCSYCGKGGASLGCCVSHCRKQFHLPCGREKNAVSLFYGNYKSYCSAHMPRQSPPPHIARRRANRNKGDESSEVACVICYEPVTAGRAFWPPCCARDAWLHSHCLQRMCLSAGLHYLRCPLCNDQRRFFDAVMEMGYYVPDRDASWELEQNAFADIYSRSLHCDANRCHSVHGPQYKGTGEWEIKPCLLCGTSGIHIACLQDDIAKVPSNESEIADSDEKVYVCVTCQPAAPTDINELREKIQELLVSEQPAAQPPRPAMPTRMSLRRTKGNVQSTSSNAMLLATESTEKELSNTAASREQLNLKILRTKNNSQTKNSDPLKSIHNTMSPMKIIYKEIVEKIERVGAREKIEADSVLELVRDRCKKPKPLCVKKRIANNILDSLLNSTLNETPKERSPLKNTNTPTKHTMEQILQELKKSPITSEVLRFPPPAKSNGNSPVKQDTRKELSYTPKKQSTNKKENEAPYKVNVSNTEENEAKKLNDVKKKEDEPNKPVFNDLTNSPYKSSIINEGTVFVDNNSDSDSNSFQLPPEFIANTNSDDEYEVYDPLKKKTVHIEKDSSLEIFSGKESVQINMTKLDIKCDEKPVVKYEKCVLKMSPNKDFIANAVEIDLDSFKNQYLNEVGSKFCCGYNHKHKKCRNSPPKLSTPIDFAYNACKKEGIIKNDENTVKLEGVKRKSVDKPRKAVKRKLKGKNSRENDNKRRRKDRVNEITVVCTTDSKNDENVIDLTVEKERLRTKRSKKKKKSRQNFKVKIKWREERLNLKISKSMERKKDKKKMSLKQYVLCSPDTNNCKGISKPDKEVTPIKKKCVKKNDKSPDNLFQTSLMSFFKPK